MQCVAVCCSVFQCVSACCSVLQCVVMCCSVLQCVVVCCSVLQCVTVIGLVACKSLVLRGFLCRVVCSTCNALQHTATHYNTLRHTASCVQKHCVSLQFDSKTPGLWWICTALLQRKRALLRRHRALLQRYRSFLCTLQFDSRTSPPPGRFQFSVVQSQKAGGTGLLLFSLILCCLACRGSLLQKSPRKETTFCKRDLYATLYSCYGMATISKLLKIIGLFCRIRSLL